MKSKIVALLFLPMAVVHASPLDEARDAWHLCIAARITALDDGVSPASDIAFAVQGDCAEEHSAMLSRMTLSPQMRYQFEGDRRESTIRAARIITVKLRAARRQQAN